MKKLAALIVAIITLSGCVTNDAATMERFKWAQKQEAKKLKLKLDAYKTVPPDSLMLTYHKLSNQVYTPSSKQILNTTKYPELVTDAGYARQELSLMSLVNNKEIKRFEDLYGQKYIRSFEQQAAWEIEQKRLRKLELENKNHLAAENAFQEARNRKGELEVTLSWAVEKINDNKLALNKSTSQKAQQELKDEILYLQSIADEIIKILSRIQSVEEDERNKAKRIKQMRIDAEKQQRQQIIEQVRVLRSELEQKELIENLKRLRDSNKVEFEPVDTRPWAARQCKWINGRKFCPE